jgi:hypothetical protein
MLCSAADASIVMVTVCFWFPDVMFQDGGRVNEGSIDLGIYFLFLFFVLIFHQDAWIRLLAGAKIRINPRRQLLKIANQHLF